jgi:hypothetical protein
MALPANGSRTSAELVVFKTKNERKPEENVGHSSTAHINFCLNYTKEKRRVLVFFLSFINFRNQSVNISKQFTEETNEFNPDEQKKKRVAHIGVAKYFLGTQTLSSNREQEKEREKKE